LQGGDDVDEVAQLAAEPVDFPDDQGVAAAQVGQAGVPLWAVGLGSGGGVGVGLQAVRGAQGVELQFGSWSAVDTRAYPILSPTATHTIATHGHTGVLWA